MEECPFSLTLSDLSCSTYGAHKPLDIFLESQFDPVTDHKVGCYDYNFPPKQDYDVAYLHDNSFQIEELCSHLPPQQIEVLERDLLTPQGNFECHTANHKCDFLYQRCDLGNLMNPNPNFTYESSVIKSDNKSSTENSRYEGAVKLFETFTEKELNQINSDYCGLTKEDERVKFFERPLKRNVNEMGAQTDGFMIPLNGPFYISSQDCVISDEKLIDACFHFMQLRSEFLSMLGYSTLNVEDESLLADYMYQHKEKKKHNTLNHPAGYIEELQVKKSDPSNLGLQNVKFTNEDKQGSSNLFGKQIYAQYFDEESRASGVPIMRPIINNQYCKQSFQSKDKISTKNFFSSKTNSNSDSSELNGMYMKRRSSISDSNFQVDNGATPGRPRMNRSDFACTLCQTRNTPQWRYLDLEPVCNACYMRARKLQRATNQTTGSQSNNLRAKFARYQRFSRKKMPKFNQSGDPSRSDNSNGDNEVEPNDNREHLEMDGGYEVELSEPTLNQTISSIIDVNRSTKSSFNVNSSTQIIKVEPPYINVSSYSPILEEPRDSIDDVTLSSNSNPEHSSYDYENEQILNSVNPILREVIKNDTNSKKQDPGTLNWSDEEEK